MGLRNRSDLIDTFTARDGSAVGYVLLAIFLTGILTAAVLSGNESSTQSQQIIAMKRALDSDISKAVGAINECALQSATPVDNDGDGDVDADDNPNVPFPLFSAFENSDNGIPLTNLFTTKCAGTRDDVFTPKRGHFFPLISDTADFTVNYYNGTADGVYIEIDHIGASVVWEQAAARYVEQTSACQAEITTADITCGVDQGSCLRYYLRRVTAC